MLDNTTTPAPAPSPVALTMLFMCSTAGLGVWRAIVVLHRFWAGAIAPAQPATPSATATSNRTPHPVAPLPTK